MPSDDLWDGAEIIDIYTRRQAIEDGVLVPLSGPGYQGDSWTPAMVAVAGFRYPVAMTTTAFCRYVSPLEGDDEKLAPCQDIKGRLWDILWMLKLANRGPILSCEKRYVETTEIISDSNAAPPGARFNPGRA